MWREGARGIRAWTGRQPRNSRHLRLHPQFHGGGGLEDVECERVGQVEIDALFPEAFARALRRPRLCGGDLLGPRYFRFAAANSQFTSFQKASR